MTRHEAFANPAALRASLDHPIIDSDAHYMEFTAGYREQFIEVAGELAGAELREALASAPDLRRYLLSRTTPFGQAFNSSRWIEQTPEQRRDTGTVMPGWAPPHSNPLDKATALLPALRAERLEEIGIDYSVLYASLALAFPHIEPTELRQVACRTQNIINANAYGPYRSQMTPAALIPMATPDEAVAELDFAIGQLGLKVAMIGAVARPAPAIHRDHPELFQSVFRIDAFGIDSDYDYDPFWARCEALKVPLVSHNASVGVGFRRSPTNYIFNQTTNFAEAGEVLTRSLFLGGVTRRFPSLKVQFLECGAGWACILYAELVHRWEKRNAGAIMAHVEAARAAEPEFQRLVERYGGAAARANRSEQFDPIAAQLGTAVPPDDFAACGIESARDVHDLFVPRFFFGCEADDPITPWAFNTAANPCGARLRAVLGSDMGHWDVPDVRGILPEALEMVEHGHLSQADFRRFAFEHPLEFFAGVNPRFFDGTKLEAYVG